MGKYSIVVEKSAQKELQAHFKVGDKGIIKKIEQIFNELSVHPETGTGKPEALRHNLSGCWSRRINREHRIIYEVLESTVRVLSAKGHYSQ